MHTCSLISREPRQGALLSSRLAWSISLSQVTLVANYMPPGAESGQDGQALLSWPSYGLCICALQKPLTQKTLWPWLPKAWSSLRAKEPFNAAQVHCSRRQLLESQKRCCHASLGQMESNYWWFFCLFVLEGGENRITLYNPSCHGAHIAQAGLAHQLPRIPLS